MLAHSAMLTSQGYDHLEGRKQRQPWKYIQDKHPNRFLWSFLHFLIAKLSYALVTYSELQKVDLGYPSFLEENPERSW